MKILKSYNNKNYQELIDKLLNFKKQYFNLRMLFSTNKLKQTHLLRLYRKNIARIKTILTKIKNNEI